MSDTGSSYFILFNGATQHYMERCQNEEWARIVYSIEIETDSSIIRVGFVIFITVYFLHLNIYYITVLS